MKTMLSVRQVKKHERVLPEITPCAVSEEGDDDACLEDYHIKRMLMLADGEIYKVHVEWTSLSSNVI
ncbi:hypothetical protein H5410_026511 [Solanum commersonii]|uniref:Uncharacterized protein n=1 Tax=Solanum commersonii TaxID=4109 RepID=A0A9J5YWC5_SOLCO|nr:hypothetical protein H5410_026511 [Solanum commersonii]